MTGSVLDNEPILVASQRHPPLRGPGRGQRVDFTIPERSIVSLIGPNGAGKTTFFNVLLGVIDPTEGSVEFRGRRMIARPHRIAFESLIWVTPAVVLGLHRRGWGGGRDPERPPAGPRRRGGAAAPDQHAAAVDHPPGLVPEAPGAPGHLPQRAPQRHGRGGCGQDLPEHPPVQEHDGHRERAGGHASQAAREPRVRHVQHQDDAGRGEGGPEPCPGAARAGGPPGQGQRGGPQPPLRRPASPGDRAGTRV